MMKQTQSFGYAADELMQALSVRLVDGTLSLVILLPRKGMFADVEENLNAGGLYSIVQAMKPSDVRCTIPRFTVRTRRRLNNDLQALGMTDAFGPAADFSGITGGTNSLFISFVIHESVMEVNEKGLEAAAATAVGMAEGVSQDRPEFVDFTADRPFFYALYDYRSDAVLFLGRVMDPRSE
jgi:serpin B